MDQPTTEQVAPPARTVEQANDDYSRYCGLVGHTEFKILRCREQFHAELSRLRTEIEEYQAKQLELDQEVLALRQNQSGQATE